MPLMKLPNHLRLIVAIPPWAIRSRRAVLIDHGAVGVMIPRCRYLRSACSPCRASGSGSGSSSGRGRYFDLRPPAVFVVIVVNIIVVIAVVDSDVDMLVFSR